MGAPIEAGVWCYPTTSANSIVPVLSRYTFYVSGLVELHASNQIRTDLTRFITFQANLTKLSCLLDFDYG